MERYRKPEGIFQTVVFVFKHDAGPKIVEEAIENLTYEQKQIKTWIEMGMLSKNELQETLADRDLQEKYEIIMRGSKAFGNAYKDAEHEIEMLKTKETAGWYDFRLKSFEKQWDLQLLNDDERVLPFSA